MNLKELIEQVIIALVNGEDLSSLTSKLQVISRMLKNKTFKEWIDLEFINGYNGNIEIPTYRKIRTRVLANYFTYGMGGLLQLKNQQIPIGNLGVEIYDQITIIKIDMTVVEIANIAKKDSAVCLALSPWEMGRVQQLLGSAQIQNVWKETLSSTLINIIEQTKAKLIDILMELNDTIFENGINFNAMEKENEVQKTVTNYIYASNVNMGDGSIDATNSNNVGGQSNVLTVNRDYKSDLFGIVNEIESLSNDIDCDRDDIANAIIEIRQELDKPESKSTLLKTLFTGIKGCVVDVINTEAGQAIKHLVENSIEIISK